MKRRMAAILVADVVAYSSLMEADEEGTAHRLAGCRTLIGAQVAQCDGRLFKAMGDAVLVEFASPINAVRCATAIRAGLALAEQGAERPLRMRFGLHLADVMVEDDDLIGDGVNVAARIQQAADPDAIDVSAALFEQIRRNFPFAFDDRGEQELPQHRRAGPCLPPPRGSQSLRLPDRPHPGGAHPAQATLFAGRDADRDRLRPRGSAIPGRGHCRGADLRAWTFRNCS